MPATPAYPPLPPWQVVVAPLAEAIPRLEGVEQGAPPYRWSELGTADEAQIGMLQCVLEGIDAAALLDPIQEVTNPFTREVVRLTNHHRVCGAIEGILYGELLTRDQIGEQIADGVQPEGAIVFRVPPAVVAAIAPMTNGSPEMLGTGDEWARAWSALGGQDRPGAKTLTSEEARRDLAVLVTASKIATAEQQDVFLWTPG